MAEHTPGPWRIVREDQTVILSPDTSIAMLFRDGDVEYSDFESPFDDVFEANARLIAAAPDLLAALTKAEASLAVAASYVKMEQKRMRFTLESIRDAIAQAKLPTQPSKL